MARNLATAASSCSPRVRTRIGIHAPVGESCKVPGSRSGGGNTQEHTYIGMDDCRTAEKQVKNDMQPEISGTVGFRAILLVVNEKR